MYCFSETPRTLYLPRFPTLLSHLPPFARLSHSSRRIRVAESTRLEKILENRTPMSAKAFAAIEFEINKTKLKLQLRRDSSLTNNKRFSPRAVAARRRIRNLNKSCAKKNDSYKGKTGYKRRTYTRGRGSNNRGRGFASCVLIIKCNGGRGRLLRHLVFAARTMPEITPLPPHVYTRSRREKE